MKTVSIIKIRNGYYIEKRIGCNTFREYRKTMKDALKLKKEWEA